MNQSCPIREHVPDPTGMCRVCGQECFRPCAAEETFWNSDVPVTAQCQLYAGHEEEHNFGMNGWD